MRLEREDARAFYLQESVDGNWSTRQLERQVSSHYFERMVMTQKDYRSLVKQEADSKKEQMEPAHIIKDPYVLEFLNLKSNTSFYESELEQALIDKLREFLLELGKGFSFVSRQYRISAGTKHFYVDLVFYNYILKCFLLIDLKTGELTHQDIGQVDFYVRYFEDQVRQETDNPTIGLILCAESNRTIVKYSLLKDSKDYTQSAPGADYWAMGCIGYSAMIFFTASEMFCSRFLGLSLIVFVPIPSQTNCSLALS